MILATLVCIFFLTRSFITLVSSFSKSPFVPLRRTLRERALALLDLGEGDNFLDIGCGDGRVVFFCAKKYPDAKSYKGIEIISILVLFARLRRFFTKKVDGKQKIFFERRNAMNYSYDGYNKVFMYLLPDFVAELMTKLEKELPSKSVVVSVAFKIPDIYKRSGKLCVEEVKWGRRTKKIYIWKKK